MLFLFISVIAFGLCLCGVGCLFGKISGYSTPRNPWIYFWLGYFVVSTLSMFISLFVPINLISLIIFFILGAAGLPFFYKEYIQSTKSYSKIEIKIFMYMGLLILFIITCLSAFTTWTGWACDTDLYHAQIIRWYNEYGTPPGLGNLHGRLAFNSSWLSLAALFDNGIWDGRSAWIMPSLSLFGGIFYCLHELFFSRSNGIKLYALCIMVYISLYIVSGLANPALNYDTPVHIINAIIILEAYYMFNDYTVTLLKNKNNDSAILMILSVSAFMIKPIGAVSLIFTGLLTLYLLVKNKKQTVSSWFVIYTPALCAFAVWVTKNLFLSGYPLYPLPVFAVSFDWAMPFESVNNGIYKEIIAWARMPGPEYRQSLENGFLFWFKPWLVDNLKLKVFLALIVLPSFLSILFWFLVIKYAKIKETLYFFIWTLFSIIYWFVTAPCFRFGDGFFWVWLGTAFLFLAPDSSQFKITVFWNNPKLRIAFIYFCILGIICGIGFNKMSPVRSLVNIGTITSRPVKEYIVDSNPPFSVWIPLDPNYPVTGNSPLPSAPYPSSNIEMREPGNLGKGFRVRRQ